MDRDALHRIAQLDSAETPEGALIVGEIDGVVRAAVALGSGRTIADPFHATAELVTLLHTRARQLRDARGGHLRVIARSAHERRRRPGPARSALRTT